MLGIEDAMLDGELQEDVELPWSEDKLLHISDYGIEQIVKDIKSLIEIIQLLEKFICIIHKELELVIIHGENGVEN